MDPSSVQGKHHACAVWGEVRRRSFGGRGSHSISRRGIAVADSFGARWRPSLAVLHRRATVPLGVNGPDPADPNVKSCSRSGTARRSRPIRELPPHRRRRDGAKQNEQRHPGAEVRTSRGRAMDRTLQIVPVGCCHDIRLPIEGRTCVASSGSILAHCLRFPAARRFRPTEA